MGACCACKCCPCRCRNGKCVRRRVGLSHFHFCCCCHTPISSASLPILDETRSPAQQHYQDKTLANKAYFNANIVTVPSTHTKFEPKKDLIKQHKVRIVTLSDSHNHHESYTMPSGDILVVAGDWCKWKTSTRDIDVFAAWLHNLLSEKKLYKHIVIIAGNHETCLDPDQPDLYKIWFAEKVGPECYYLQDSSVVLLGLKFYGTPWHPKRGCLYKAEAFGMRVRPLRKLMESIDADTDVLVTHVPPHGIRDVEIPGHVGSDALLRNVVTKMNPYLHVFGHCHHGTGLSYVQGCDTLFVNTATRPRVFDLVFEGVKETGAIGNDEVEEKNDTMELTVGDNVDANDVAAVREQTPSEGSQNDDSVDSAEGARADAGLLENPKTEQQYQTFE